MKRTGAGLPSRVVLHGVEGVGKTSFAASSPSPVVLMSKGETGLETLIDSQRLAETPHFPEVQQWSDAIGAIDELTLKEHEFKTLVLDTGNGLERLCHEHVCERDYKGDWGPNGFAAYGRGYQSSVAEWRMLLAKLDRLRSKKQMALIVLVHTAIKPYRNPTGEDFDRFQPDLHKETWSLTHKWADMVLFARFFEDVDSETGRAKGIGGQQRVIYTERHAAYDAKNRHGLPEFIQMGSCGSEAWANFMTAVKTARKEGGE